MGKKYINKNVYDAAMDREAPRDGCRRDTEA